MATNPRMAAEVQVETHEDTVADLPLRGYDDGLGHTIHATNRLARPCTL